MKRGMSTVISITLLILVTISAITILSISLFSHFEDFSKTPKKIDLSIDTQNGYTFYDHENKITCVQISRGADKAKLKQIKIIFFISGNSFYSIVPPPESSNTIEINNKEQFCFNLSKYGKPEKIEISSLDIHSNYESEILSSTKNINEGKIAGTEKINQIYDEEESSCGDSICEKNEDYTTCIEDCENQVNNVKNFGVYGDGVHDDTIAINNLINSVSSQTTTGQKGIIYFPNGVYMINVKTPVLLKDNIHLYLEKNATLKAFPSNLTSYKVLKIYGVSNISIFGGSIEGERYNHTILNHSEPGEWGMCIQIEDSYNIQISNITLLNAWGDGIYLGNTDKEGPKRNTNITLSNMVIDNCRRQGITIIEGENILIKNSLVKNTHGTPPTFGIDIEPNYIYEYSINVSIENVTTKNNTGGGIEIGRDLWGINSSVYIINHISELENIDFEYSYPLTDPGILYYNGEWILSCNENYVCEYGETLNCIDCAPST